jgi:peptidoglycan/xylan/chitin deacetylase (PgdA/CDA1 family)
MSGDLVTRVYLSVAQRKALRSGFGVLTFHKVAEPPANTVDRFEYTSPAQLDARLQAALKEGFVLDTLDGFVGEATSRVGRLAVTFDDGYASVLTNGLEVLARHRVRAIEFLVADKLGGRNDWDVAKGDVSEPLMDAVQVREWLTAGHAIGSHSLTHPNLRKIPRAQAREEIVASRKRLEDLFGVPVRHFCYPYGSFDDVVRDLVAEAGYLTACTVEHGVNASRADDFRLRRIVPLTARELVAKAFHRLFRNVGWFWGK